jgi:hypothetical protein
METKASRTCSALPLAVDCSKSPRSVDDPDDDDDDDDNRESENIY